MPQFQLRHVPLVARAIGRWLVGTKAGRRTGAVVGAAVIATSLMGAEHASRRGTWAGLSNHYAPSSGTIVLEGAPGTSAHCKVRGETGTASGNGWVFRGNAKVEETSCQGRVEKNGRVSAVLELEMVWSGRVKGIGGDWDDVSGSCTCRGDLKGTLEAGGKWTAKCKKKDSPEWETSLTWKLASG